MWPPHLIHGLGIVQLDVQILVYTLQGSSYLHLVLEFNGDFVLDERFEETILEELLHCSLNHGAQGTKTVQGIWE